MIKLTAAISDGLLELIRANEVQLDAVEVGPWASVAQVRAFRQSLPGWTVYLHYGNLVSELKWVPGTAQALRAYCEVTQTPWLSFHYSLLPPGYVWLARKTGWYLPLLESQDKMIRYFVDRVEELKRFNLPILLENMPSFPTRQYIAETAVDIIAEILARTGCDFLLDLAHTRSAAAVWGLDVHDYISRLPLEKVRQIHVSGPRLRNGHLFDAHEDMQAEDYRLLAWTLERTRPEMVTLEYFRDREKTRCQLARLKEMIGAS
ncbi:MAG TPA: DUF692 family protein [Anaerolineaceae bacterium]|nr:DUF692 family protein [Anaerolineaceae bacterium]HPN53057.1 DUF692 family protein [Anaerolineaceae bacterium]